MTNEQLVARIRSGEDEAYNMLALWQQNRGFIAKLAKKYQCYAEMDDLMQEGYLGLCEAVRHYDVEQGIPFINYAAFWIKQAMKRYIDNCCSSVRFPVHVREWNAKYNRVVREYRKYYGAEPPDSALRALLGVDTKKLQSIKENARMSRISSLSEPISGDDGEITIVDTLASGEDIEEECIERLDKETMKRELWIAVDQLPGEQPEVIRQRYQRKMTLKEVGQELGLSSSQVRELQNKAMRTLRLPGRSRKFRIYFDQYLSAASCRHVGIERFRRTWTSEVERAALDL